MSYRFAASTTGPLAKIAGSLALPPAMQLNSKNPHHIWALVDHDQPTGRQNAWAIFPIAAAAVKERFCPCFESVDDWLPGMTALLERRTTFRATAAAEVSALWTSLAATSETAIAGDVGLDLDLGIQVQAQWEAYTDCWWSIHRAGDAPVLRVRLYAARASARSVSVKATASAGLDQATQNALAAIRGRHRNQFLHRLRQGVHGTLGKLPASKKKLRALLEGWLALPPETQAEQWRNPVDTLLAKLKKLIDAAAGNMLADADQLTARLEYAAVRAMEKAVETSIKVIFDKRQSTEAIFDADFDFAANPELKAIFHRTLNGGLAPLLSQSIAGLTLRHCAMQTDLTRRRTFSWRLPFSPGLATGRERLHSAMEALDDETGRVVRANAKVESERRTRHASGLLSIECAFAACFGGEVIVHDPASSSARFALDFRTNRPLALQPLLDLYNAGPAERRATGCRLEISLPPESIAHWLEPRYPAEVARRMRTAWRALLPAVVDMDSLNLQAAAPLLVWASRTRAALEARLALTHLTATVDDVRRVAAEPMNAAVFSVLSHTEAQLIDRLVCQLGQGAATPRNPVEIMKNLSAMLAGMTEAFHRDLTPIYGSEAARALGPLLLSAASPAKPEVKVTWSR